MNKPWDCIEVPYSWEPASMHADDPLGLCAAGSLLYACVTCGETIRAAVSYPYPVTCGRCDPAWEPVTEADVDAINRDAGVPVGEDE